MTERWQDEKGISDLSLAIDEIYFLRAVLADEASIIETYLDFKTFPKSRRPIAEQQFKRMVRIAKGELRSAQRERFDAKRALRWIGAQDLLTNSQWAEQRGLSPVGSPRSTSPDAEVVHEVIRCPVHHIPDCSVLLNGCSIPNRLAAAYTAGLNVGLDSQEKT